MEWNSVMMCISYSWLFFLSGIFGRYLIYWISQQYRFKENSCVSCLPSVVVKNCIKPCKRRNTINYSSNDNSPTFDDDSLAYV